MTARGDGAGRYKTVHDGLGANANITVWFGQRGLAAAFQQSGEKQVIRAIIGDIPFVTQLDLALKGQL